MRTGRQFDDRFTRLIRTHADLAHQSYPSSPSSALPTGAIRQGNRAAERDDRRTAAVATAFSDGIVAMNDERQIVLFDAGAEAMFGCSATYATGQPIDRFVRARFPGPTDTPPTADVPLLAGLRTDGTEFPLTVRAVQVVGSATPCALVVIRDMTGSIASASNGGG